MRIGCFHPILRRLFNTYGRFVGRHPHLVLAGSLLVAGLVLCGLVRLWHEDNMEYLFSPINAPSKSERDRFDNAFPEDAKNQYSTKDACRHCYSHLRSTVFGQFLFLIVTATEGNVLSSGAIADVIRLDAAVRAVKSQGINTTYEDLCGKNTGVCPINPVLQIIGILRAYGDEPSQIRYPVHDVVLPDGSRIDVFDGYTLGGVSVEGGKTKAKAWKLQYMLQPDHPAGTQWELDALAAVAQLKLQNITVFRFASRSIPDELHEVTKRVSPLFLAAFLLMLTFSIISLLSGDWLVAKPTLAIAGVVSSTIAISSGFGLCSLVGVPAADIVAACPFLIIGIGVDDTFIMVAAWRRTDHRLTVENRMGQTFSDAAVAVTITTLTDVLSISVGALAPFRSVQIFCAYTVAGILFDFFYQLTFFGAWMAMSGRREADGKHPMACTKVIPAIEAGDRSTLFRWFCTGGNTVLDRRPTPKSIIFFRDSWADMLNTRVVKVSVFVLYAAYLSMAIWGCTKVREGLKLSRLAVDDSYVSFFYDASERYFSDYNMPIGVMIEGEIRPWEMDCWLHMEEVLQAFENDTDFFHDTVSTFAWTRRFEQTFGKGIVWDRDNFTRAHGTFLAGLANSQYALDVKWNREKTAMVATRFYVTSKNVATTVRETAMMQRAREIAVDASNAHQVTVFHPFFIFYDKYAIIVPTTIRNLALATGAMFVVSMLFIPSLICSVSVTLSIASICAGIIGFMTWWDVNLDCVSMVDIIICIGFSVDYSAHVTNAFVTAEGADQLDRMRNAFALVGYPIVQCAASSILAIMLLILEPGYMLRAFFKIMFLVVVFGFFHGLLVIPEIFLACGGVAVYHRPSERNSLDPAIEPSSISRQELEGFGSTGGRHMPAYWQMPSLSVDSERVDPSQLMDTP